MERGGPQRVYHYAALEPQTEEMMLSFMKQMRAADWPAGSWNHEHLLLLIDGRLRAMATYQRSITEKAARQLLEIRLAYDNLESLSNEEKELPEVDAARRHLRNLINDDGRFSLGGYYEIVDRELSRHPKHRETAP